MYGYSFVLLFTQLEGFIYIVCIMSIKTRCIVTSDSCDVGFSSSSRREWAIPLLFIAITIGVIIWGVSFGLQAMDEKYAKDDTIKIVDGQIDKLWIEQDQGYSSTVLYVFEISNKSYDLGDFTDFLGDAKDVYYILEVGDNITIYESCRIKVNGKVIYERGAIV